MAFCFTVGTHEFQSALEGYENVTARCMNCGNWSGHCVKRWPWFTFCFVPVIPLALHPYKDIICHICRFTQPLEARPDVQPMAQNQYPLQSYGGSNPGPGSGPGPGTGAAMSGGSGAPVYK